MAVRGERNMVDLDALKIEKAIRRLQQSRDDSNLIETLLYDALNWPIRDDMENEVIHHERTSYPFNEHLTAQELSRTNQPIELRQIAPFPNWQYGICVLRFGSSTYLNEQKEMTPRLRAILADLIENKRLTSNHPIWKRKHLIFLCYWGTEYVQFARFEQSHGHPNMSTFVKFGWGPNDNIRTVCAYHLKYLIYNDKMNEDEVQKSVDFAFDRMKVANDFIQDYKKEFELAKPIVEKNSDLSRRDDIHQATQLLFHRLLVLRFIEEKRWLSFIPHEDDLRAFFRAGPVDSDTSFYRSRLRRLFFEGLAQEGKNDDSAYGRVPFLNGVLFEENDLDKSIIDLPDDLFERILGKDGLFYRWNFTTFESTTLEVEVAVDPEIIGRLFEELVPSRHEKGAYYTPRPVVAYMCREAFKSLLSNNTEVNTESIHQLIDENHVEGMNAQDANIIHVFLNEIKAVDPACGSGAYLVGFLQELVRIYSTLSTVSEDLAEGRYEMKVRIITNSIYGADLDKFAIELARLRLWFSTSLEATQPEFMLNLDLNILNGDSICNRDPHWVKATQSMDPLGSRTWAEQMKEIRHLYVTSSGNRKHQLWHEYHALQREIIAMKEKDDEEDSIDFGATFYDIFDRDNGGFDIVLANPPFVRQEEIDKKIKTAGLRNYPTLVKGTSDLYIYFYARAKQLLREGGISCFVCSNSWLDVEFGAPLQHDVLRHFKDIQIIDFRTQRMFESAEVNTIISLMEKNVSKKFDHEIKFIMLEDVFEKSIHNPRLKTEKSISTEELLSRGHDVHGTYIGYKWSLILRAPEIYHRIINHHSDKFIPIRDVCKRTRRNNLAVLPKGYKVQALSAESNQDSVAFLHSFKDVHSIKLDTSKQKSIVHPQVQHSLQDKNFRRADIISNRFFGARIFFIEGGDFFVNDSFFIGQLHEKYRIKNTILALNSTLSMMFVEFRGRKGQGGGVLAFYGPEFNGHHIINPTLLDGIDDAIYDSFIKREIGNVFEECGFAPDVPIREQEPTPREDRKAVDEYIFDILELSREERNEVYWCLCEAVQHRVLRSRSV